jgi:hypothetical protein
MFRPNRFLSLFLATAVLAGATGCDDDDDPTAPVEQGRVRAVHAVGNAPAVDILVDGEVVTPAAGLSYGNKTSYIDADEGNRAVAVRATGTTLNLLTFTAPVAADADYTVIAAGRIGATSGPTPRLISITDNAAPTTGNANVRVVHASPSAGNVDVYVTAPGADIATATPVLTNVAFGAVANLANVAPGTYRIRVTPTGTKTVAIDENNVVIAANGKYLAIAVGDDAPGTGEDSAYDILLFPENAN